MSKIQGVYAICDISFSPHLSHVNLATQLLQGGIRLIQLRMKGERDLSKITATAKAILNLKNDFDFTFILNDFVKIAQKIPVDGIHLGQDDMTIGEARKILGPNKIIGYSSHSLEEAIAAERQEASYVALGAIYPTKTKGPGHPVQGIDTLKAVVEVVHIPLVAIGGIGRDNFDTVVGTGTAALAMITALSCASDITNEARYFVNRWKAC